MSILFALIRKKNKKNFNHCSIICLNDLRMTYIGYKYTHTVVVL